MMAANSLRVLVVMGVMFVLLMVSTPTRNVNAQAAAINSDYIREYGLRDLESAVIIRAEPPNPGVGESVTLTVESPVYDLARDLITWTINGSKVTSGKGVTSIDTTTSSNGTALDVVVSAEDSVWGTATQALSLVPAQVDILYDGPTYVPPFYRGRVLPSAGGKIRLQAVTRFSEGGTQLKDSEISYTWSRNGAIIANVSGVGKSRITIDAPTFSNTDEITVRATTDDESLTASASIVVRNGQPQVSLYEDHPLYGIQFHKAFSPETQLPGETTVAGYPYFVTAAGLFDANLKFSWHLNNSPIAASSTKRNELVITPGEGSAKLQLNITHAVNFLLDAVGSWKFTANSAGSAQTSQSAESDVFHSN